MHEIKKIKLKDGNEYTPVKERILYLKAANIKYKLITLLELVGGYWKAMATLTILGTGEETTGHGVVAFGKRTEGGEIMSNTGAELAETKAVGRALAFFGIGIDETIASAEEMDNAETDKAPAKQPESGEDKVLAANRELELIVARKGITVAPVEDVTVNSGDGHADDPEEVDEVEVVEGAREFLYNLNFSKVPKGPADLKASIDAATKKLFEQCLEIGVNPYCIPGMVTKAKMQKLIACDTREKLVAYISKNYGRAFVKFLDGNYPEPDTQPGAAETPHPATEDVVIIPNKEEKMDIVEEASQEANDSPFELSPEVNYHASGGTGVVDKPQDESPAPQPPKSAGGMAPNADFDKSRGVVPPPPPPPEPAATKTSGTAENMKFISTLKVPAIGPNGQRDAQELFIFQSETVEKAGFDWDDLEATVVKLGMKEKYPDGFAGVMVSGSETEVKMILSGTQRKFD